MLPPFWRDRRRVPSTSSSVQGSYGRRTVRPTGSGMSWSNSENRRFVGVTACRRSLADRYVPVAVAAPADVIGSVVM